VSSDNYLEITGKVKKLENNSKPKTQKKEIEKLIRARELQSNLKQKFN